MAHNQPNDMQVSQGNAYNTQGKNPIIFNVKGQQNFSLKCTKFLQYYFETRSHN